MSDDLVAQFAILFEGRKDAYGTEEGGCWRPELLDSHGQYHMIIDGHLSGNTPSGVYPLVLRTTIVPDPEGLGSSANWDGEPVRAVDRWSVKWGCVDFDEGDEESWVHAVNLANALDKFDITGWIERSRSKGYHVWVFAEGWVDATLMREALLAACQVVDAPTREINPKQTSLEGDGVGNYVRLPYPGWLADPGAYDRDSRRTMVSPVADDYGGTWPLQKQMDDFLKDAMRTRCTSDQLKQLADLYVEPKAAPRRLEYRPTAATFTDLHDRMSSECWHIYQNGPYEPGVHRSETLVRLAAKLHREGKHTFSEIVQIVTEADARWGKYYNRPNGDELIRRLVQGVTG
jgi:hypothetical protein